MVSEFNEFAPDPKNQEAQKIPFNTAEPPPEIIRILKKNELDSDTIKGWLAVPAIKSTVDRNSLNEMQIRGQVDAHALLQPLLGNQVLDSTLRTIDVLNGCGHQCATCLADSAIPSRIFSLDSLDRLFSDDRFVRMLQPDSLRIGSSGDLLDHPQGIEIVEMILEKTKMLDEQRFTESHNNKRHHVKVFTNYRPNKETQLDRLITVAQTNPARLSLTISLPFNKTDSVNKKFTDYVIRRPDIFVGNVDVDADGLIDDSNFLIMNAQNIHIQDVRHPRVLFMAGRILSETANAGRVAAWDMVENDREISFSYRGLVKTYMNPDSLWLMIYATPYESHTGRVFTPITSQNINILSQLPYHPDFPTPPHWPGGTGKVKGFRQAHKTKVSMELSGKPKHSATVVS